MQKLFIENRKKQKLAVIVEQSEQQRGLAIIMHGLGGFKEQDHLIAIADCFKEKGFTVIRFDTTNTLGESDGNYEQATLTNYYEDMEDVIGWAAGQSWYQEPFVLLGHSLGGISVALYAEKYPQKVLALAPISPVVSGALSVEAHKKYDVEGFAHWEQTGWYEQTSISKPGTVKRLPWSHIVDRLKYDLLPRVSTLTMPTLLIVGEQDTATPPDQIRLLFDALPGQKEFYIIKGAPHTFRAPEHLSEIRNIIALWIDAIHTMAP